MMYLMLTNIVLLFILSLVIFTRRKESGNTELEHGILDRITHLENRFRDEFRMSRSESAESQQRSRTELMDIIRKSLEQFGTSFDRNVQSFNELQKEKFASLESRQHDLVRNTENKLDSIRTIVEEKLDKTLNERLRQSFSTVSTQLAHVQQGLGEMQALASDVGGLKKVLSNVKMRGGFGEIQLSMLLEQLLSPEQFATNVRPKPGSAESVEFAIKLPGRDDHRQFIWLPVDAKFPKEVFGKLQHAYDGGDVAEIDLAKKLLFSTIKKMAKDICEKYVSPPETTDFAIMFLPFEGIFAEVVRQAGLLEEIQRDHKVIVTGPTTLGAILNSLQMGFKTLAIQKRSSEVWQVLSEVKREFETFGGMLGRAQSNIQTGLNQLEQVMGVRTRAINRKLRSVETLETAGTNEIASGSDGDVAVFLTDDEE